MLKPDHKNVQIKVNKFSKEIEKLAENPIQENEAGQIEGGFAESLTPDAIADEDIVINFWC